MQDIQVNACVRLKPASLAVMTRFCPVSMPWWAGQGVFKVIMVIILPGGIRIIRNLSFYFRCVTTSRALSEIFAPVYSVNEIMGPGGLVPQRVWRRQHKMPRLTLNINLSQPRHLEVHALCAGFAKTCLKADAMIPIRRRWFPPMAQG